MPDDGEFRRPLLLQSVLTNQNSFSFKCDKKTMHSASCQYLYIISQNLTFIYRADFLYWAL